MPQPGPPSRLAENIVHFARVLRRAGLPVGPGKVLAAIEAVQLVGVERRDDVRSALAATLLDRAEQRVVFDQAFQIFWRDPKLLERMMHLLLPKVSGRLPASRDPSDPSSRVVEAFKPERKGDDRAQASDEPVELDAALTFSAREVLQQKDFEAMSADELVQAKRMLATLELRLPQILTRRFSTSPTGHALGRDQPGIRSSRHGRTWRTGGGSCDDRTPGRYRKPGLPRARACDRR